MMLIDSTMAVPFRSSSTAVSYCRPLWTSDDFSCANVTVPWSKINRIRRQFDHSFTRRSSLYKARTEACAKYLSSGSDNAGETEKSGYHPFEDILVSESNEAVGEARLTAAETCRTVIEVNSQASLLFSSMTNDEVEESIFWPDLPYLTDEHGNIYFQVNNDEDIMQTLTSEDNYVQVIIGLNTKELIGEMELSGPSAIDLGIEEIEIEDSDFDDDEEDDEEDGDDDQVGGEWVDILEDDIDQMESDGSLDSWAKLQTTQSSHHMYFAKKLAEIASDDPINVMDQPPAGIAIQGLLRPAFIEEQSVIQRHRNSHNINDDDVSKALKPVQTKGQVGVVINGHPNESASSGDDSVPTDNVKSDNNGLGNGTAFYKLEMMKIQLLSADGNQAVVEVEDCRKARPDAIAHSASKIISRVSAAGEKTTNALKSLCMRCKGIQIEEAALIGIDSLGFDLRICSGTQVQTLRFAFSSRATSEYSAERQLNDMLFPRNKQKKVKQVHQKES